MNKRFVVKGSGLSLLALAVVVACSKSPPEPGSTSSGDAATASSGASTPSGAPSASSAPADPTVVKTGGADPLNGNFSLADATKDIPGSGALLATLATPKGNLTCKLYEDKAPKTVANFVGLATGTRPWKNHREEWVKTPMYDGTTFHRIIKGFMIQGGDAIGAKRGRAGVGEPGYVIPDEVWPGATHDRAGLLCMANRGPNTNGAQFFITDAPALNLDGGYTIFGECAPVDTIHQLASWPVSGDQAVNPPVISKVTIAREKPAK